MQHIFFTKNTMRKALESGRMHENTFFVFPFFEMQFLCFFVFLCNTHPFSFHYIFFGTFYNYISLQKQNKHNNKLNTNTTFKTTKQKPSETLFTSETTQEQWWRVIPRAATTGGAWFHAPPREGQNNGECRSASSLSSLAGNDAGDLQTQTKRTKQAHKASMFRFPSLPLQISDLLFPFPGD